MNNYKYNHNDYGYEIGFLG